SGIGGDKTQMNKGVNDYWIIKTNGGVLPNGVAEHITGDIKIDVFPNPVSKYATLCFSLNEASATVIELIDMSGQVIKLIADDNFAKGNNTIHFNSQSIMAGMYFLKVNYKKGIAIKKILIE
ncbi:MAG: T9SS type A sorting domain-containing protein, partial [Bacteroidia bacterium]